MTVSCLQGKSDFRALLPGVQTPESSVALGEPLPVSQSRHPQLGNENK